MVYGIITYLLKKLVILAFWVLEVNVKDFEVYVTEGSEEPTQSELSLHIDSLWFHRRHRKSESANDSWKQLTISSVTLSYSSCLANSPFLLAQFPNDLCLRVLFPLSLRLDRLIPSLSRQSSDSPHPVLLLRSLPILPITLPLPHSSPPSIPSFSHSSLLRITRFPLSRLFFLLLYFFFFFFFFFFLLYCFHFLLYIFFFLPFFFFFFHPFFLFQIGSFPILAPIHALLSMVFHPRLPRRFAALAELLPPSHSFPGRPHHRHHRRHVALRLR